MALRKGHEMPNMFRRHPATAAANAVLLKTSRRSHRTCSQYWSCPTSDFNAIGTAVCTDRNKKAQENVFHSR